jgi:hypothetical protein
MRCRGTASKDVAAKNAGNSTAFDSLTRADRTIVRRLVVERLNLLGDPFIQNRVRIVDGIYPEEIGSDGCLRAFFAKSRNMILTFLSP